MSALQNQNRKRIESLVTKNQNRKVTAQRLTAKNNFWTYCKVVNPKFYREERVFLRELCETLQGIYEGTIINPKTGKPYRRLMINIAPRHGKSYTLLLFCQWALGKNNENRIISVSYNERLTNRFARGVRDGIDADALDDRTVFSDIFPKTKIKYGDSSAQFWALEGQYFNYLASSFGGTLTGVGCNIGIIDDPVKSHKEAYNSRILDEQWEWYGDTFASRVEEGGIEIIVMTRWSTKDLCGRILESEDADEWLVFTRQACIDEDKGIMLAPALLSWETYQRRKRFTSEPIFLANYQQKPVDEEGRLYASFATYETLPKGPDGRPRFARIVSYADTADTGSDYLAAIIAGECKGELWVLDVLYTQKPMEYTEPEYARMLFAHGVDIAWIESNNGGRGYARNVERHLWEDYQDRRVQVKWFHQSENKIARILAGSSYVSRHIYWPEGWEKRWPRFFADMSTYQRAGKNPHDDGPDAVTGLAEKVLADARKGDLSIHWFGGGDELWV